jgi:hypothetical protein
LRVKFFEKSFHITNHFPNVFLGREIPKVEGQTIADMMQGLIERGRHPDGWQHYTRGLHGKIIDHEEEESWQAQEIAGLKAEVDELKMDLDRAHTHNNWLTDCAIAAGEEGV